MSACTYILLTFDAIKMKGPELMLFNKKLVLVMVRSFSRLVMYQNVTVVYRGEHPDTPGSHMLTSHYSKIY